SPWGAREDVVAPLLRLRARRRRRPPAAGVARGAGGDDEVAAAARDDERAEVAPLEAERVRRVDRGLAELLLDAGDELREGAPGVDVGAARRGVVARVDDERELVALRVDRRAIAAPAGRGEPSVVSVDPLLEGEREAELA